MEKPKAKERRERGLQALIGLIDRVPGPRTTEKTSAELLREIDQEMDECLDRP